MYTIILFLGKMYSSYFAYFTCTYTRLLILVQKSAENLQLHSPSAY